MVCHCSVPNGCPQPDARVLHPAAASHPAKAMTPPQRQQLALEALAGAETVSRLAGEHAVSRKFVYQQTAKAEKALDAAFSPKQPDDERVLFYLPVTKAWLRQLILALTLICHSSLRGVVELLRDLFDYPLSVGTVHNVLQSAVEQARSCNEQQDLSGVRIGAHDEIFQGGRPVLAGVDTDSTYCYLLSLEDHRDADTWGADAGSGLRAGQDLAMPEVPCRGDVFHALQTVQSLATFLENRAYGTVGVTADLERKKARLRWRGRPVRGVAVKLGHANSEQSRAVALADDVAMLLAWLREDVLSLAGPDHNGNGSRRTERGAASTAIAVARASRGCVAESTWQPVLSAERRDSRSAPSEAGDHCNDYGILPDTRGNVPGYRRSASTLPPP